MDYVPSAVQGVGVQRCYVHDSEVLRRWRCDPLITGVWHQFFARDARWQVLRMKILPAFGRCW